MLKKRWLIGSVLSALIVLGITGGVIMAQTSTDTDSSKATFAARVARILGLETSTVEDAVEQVKQEIRSAVVDARLAAMVESGQITQAQADEYKASIESKPEGAFEGFGRKGRYGKHGRRGFRSGFGDHDGEGHPWKMNDSDSDDDSA